MIREHCLHFSTFKIVCLDVNECNDYKHLCGKHAKCQNSIGSYRCACVSGYHGDGQICRKGKTKMVDQCGCTS